MQIPVPVAGIDIEVPNAFKEGGLCQLAIMYELDSFVVRCTKVNPSMYFNI